MTLDAEPAERTLIPFGRLSRAEQDAVVDKCASLVDSIQPGYNYGREILLTEELRLGDTLLLMDRDDVTGFAVCHSTPLVEGRGREELRVLKFVCASNTGVELLARGVADHARRGGARRAAIRVQSDYRSCYGTLIRMGARVRWTDLRMTARGCPERPIDEGVVLSNWEI
jgi:hypothetical protein